MIAPTTLPSTLKISSCSWFSDDPMTRLPDTDCCGNELESKAKSLSVQLRGAQHRPWPLLQKHDLVPYASAARAGIQCAPARSETLRAPAHQSGIRGSSQLPEPHNASVHTPACGLPSRGPG